MIKRNIKVCCRVPVLAALVWLSAQACWAQAAATNRIAQVADPSRMIALRGDVHPLARPEFDRGAVDGAMILPRVTLFFKPTASQQADLDALLAEQQDRSSPNYHRWLTPEQFGERFGMSVADLANVAAWLGSQGLSVVETAPSRNWIVFSGTAQQVSAALRTQIHRFAVRGENHFANATEPFVPAAFADVVGGFRGLDDFRLRPAEISRAAPFVRPNFTSATSGRHFLTPDDFATIYDLNSLYGNGIDGTGQKIAVMGQTDINLTDIQAFRAAAGLAAKSPQIVLSGNDPGTQTSDVSEADLDVEWAGAVAKNATIIYVNSTGVINSMQYAISHGLAPVISISYGSCEADFGSVSFVQGLGQQANTEGITIVAASGDGGATDCDTKAPATQGLAVALPASLPTVTGVGGTQFNEGSGTYWQAASNGQDVISSALSYIPEVVWNQTPSSGNILATGGGASALFSKPVWQTGLGVPNDGKRDVPDVSFNASPDPDGYLICSQGSCTNGFRDSMGNLDEIGGTSGGTPTFAGVVALINQQTQSTGQGNINYILYPLAANSVAAFHDITSGGNEIPCKSGSTDCPAGTATIGYIAGPGYDPATGLGSPDVNSLVTGWTSISSTLLSQSSSANSASAPDFQLAVSPSTLTVAQGNAVTAQVTVTSFNGFAATPSFTCNVGAALTGVTCAVVAGGNASTFMLKVMAATGSLVHGPGQSNRPGPWLLGMAILALMVACTWGKSGRNGEPGESRARTKLVPTLAFASALVFAIGCGGGSGGNTSGNGTSIAAGSVAVTGASGSLSHTAQISVTVN